MGYSRQLRIRNNKGGRKIMETINLKDVVCRHNITINTGYHGSTVHCIVFMDPRDHETYIWKASGTAGLNWEEGETYSITAQYEGDCRLSRVKLVSHSISDQDHGKKSEQDDTRKNALDILLPDMNLTNDEKYDMIAVERRKEKCLKT